MNKDEVIKDRIIHFAENDERVRSVILNGSRANPNISPDKYQDFDILFVVENFESFIKDKNWILFLGNPIIAQIPNEMLLGNDETKEKISFSYLMIFEDGKRIDLTLFPKEKFYTDFKNDSLTVVWLDKDHLFKNIPAATDEDYQIIKPGQREYSETCNEFWWISTYVAKGLARKEIFYAKEMMETNVRPMFMKLIEWKAGIDNNFEVNFGKMGKFAKKYIDPNLYEQILKTYADSDIENNWNALITMMTIFRDLEIEIAEKLNFKINLSEATKTFEYMLKINVQTERL